jgi:hypothetical protein
MLVIAERRARPKAERFYRPSREGHVFLHQFPVRQLPDTGLLLSLSPSLLRPPSYAEQAGTSPQRAILDFFRRARQPPDEKSGARPNRSALLFLKESATIRPNGGAVPGYAAYIAAPIAERG